MRLNSGVLKTQVKYSLWEALDLNQYIYLWLFSRSSSLFVYLCNFITSMSRHVYGQCPVDWREIFMNSTTCDSRTHMNCISSYIYHFIVLCISNHGHIFRLTHAIISWTTYFNICAFCHSTFYSMFVLFTKMHALDSTVVIIVQGNPFCLIHNDFLFVHSSLLTCVSTCRL